MDKKNFSRVADKKHGAGFYVNVIFEGQPAMIEQLKHRFAMNAEVFRVLFTNAPAPKPTTLHPLDRKESTMASFNKVILAGNLTRDPELRYTPKGLPSPSLDLAVNRRWKSETGEKQGRSDLVDIDAFGKQAETIGQYSKKGRPILIEGRLRLDQWDDKQTGQKRSRWESCWRDSSSSMLAIEPKGRAPSPRSSGPRHPPTPPPPEPEAAEPEQDDVPFLFRSRASLGPSTIDPQLSTHHGKN